MKLKACLVYDDDVRDKLADRTSHHTDLPRLSDIFVRTTITTHVSCPFHLISAIIWDFCLKALMSRDN